MLHTILHGTPTDTPPLLIAHGLFGSARNFGAIARHLSDNRQVITVDMRNHGSSDWTDTHSYEDMAADLAEVLEAHRTPADVLGHSMGGKAAMVLALTRPDLIRRLIIADIAPVAYTHSQLPHIDRMRAVDLGGVSKRSEITARLAAQGVEPELQGFFSQSIDLKSQKWRLNLDVLAAEMPRIMDFPDIPGQFDGPALFLIGAQSDYVKPADRPAIRNRFTHARIVSLKGAGHWLHADKPAQFESAVRAFLQSEPGSAGKS